MSPAMIVLPHWRAMKHITITIWANFLMRHTSVRLHMCLAPAKTSKQHQQRRRRGQNFVDHNCSIGNINTVTDNNNNSHPAMTINAITHLNLNLGITIGAEIRTYIFENAGCSYSIVVARQLCPHPSEPNTISGRGDIQDNCGEKNVMIAVAF